MFINELEKRTAGTLTENLGYAVDTTTSSLLDLFAISGALRTRDEDDIRLKFNLAFSEDALLATKLAFYTRNIRGGLGERDAFRYMLKELERINPSIVLKNLHFIPHFGRWDDLFVLFDTSVEKEMIQLIKEQLDEDIENTKDNKSISLLAKWMPSISTSSKETVALAKRFAKAWNMSYKDYRKMLSELRAYLKVVEVDMTAEEWEKINYSNVPSNAMNKYRNAFYNRDEIRFKEYIDTVKAGKTTIKSGTLYPYNIVEKIFYGNEKNDVLELQWNALPNYVSGENNFLVMADVSGSMWGRPIATSIGLAIYFAERNKGPFAGRYMTFSAIPEIANVKGITLYDKVRYVENHNIGYNTNLESAFMAILQTAVETKCSQQDLPKSLIIISDMEIDAYHIKGGNLNFYDEMKDRFAQQGYVIPNVVFWNVDSRHDTYHSFKDNPNVQLVSGQSASTFKLVIEGLNLTPYEIMLKALNDPQYDVVTI